LPLSSPKSDVPVALCLGGLDPSGGAGLLRDVVILASLGVHPMAIPLAETIQNGSGCLSIQAPAASPVLSLEALRPHLGGLWGAKIGMSALDEDAFSTMALDLAALGPGVRIWDPILAPSLGVSLHDGSRLRRMAQTLLPSGEWVVCPNLVEARLLSGHSAPDFGQDCGALAQPLLKMGARAVWLKGGHGEGETVEDLWVTEAGVQSLGLFPRLSGERRGTGCTLASAWLGYRLRGLEDLDAARAAVAWLRDGWTPCFIPGGIGRPCFAPRSAC